MQYSGANPTKREVQELITKFDRVDERTGKGDNNIISIYYRACKIQKNQFNYLLKEKLP